MNTLWNDSLLIGIPRIDEQHKGFFDLFDKYEQLHNNSVDEDAEKYELIIKLEHYLEDHFITEESIMSFINYPELKSHFEEHQLFFRKIQEFKIKYQHNNTELFNSILLFMKRWLLTHIPMYDIQIRPYFDDYSKNLKK